MPFRYFSQFLCSILSPISSSQHQIQAHMKTLIHKDDWLKEVVSEHNLNSWDPDREDCCTVQQFKLHLTGTRCDPWNSSAARVFTNDFLLAHAGIYPDVWAVRSMVLKKTHTYIKTLIRGFCKGNRGSSFKLAARKQKNKYERKANVSPSKSLNCMIP